MESQGKRPPAYLGWELVIISLVAALLIPKGGFWLVLIPAFMLTRGPASSKNSKLTAAKTEE
jgi:hypothetical protein